MADNKLGDIVKKFVCYLLYFILFHFPNWHHMLKNMKLDLL